MSQWTKALKRTPNKRRKALWVEAFPEQVKRSHAVEVRKERRLYIKRKKVFLQEHPWCEWWLKHGLKRPATQIHHARGRQNGLLLNEKYWHAVSQKGHTAIHHHPAFARELGLLAPLGKWGVNE